VRVDHRRETSKLPAASTCSDNQAPGRGASPKEVVHGLKRAACDFGGGELYDDICIAALRLA
jgi:hypothetical protein